ncbi:hypothetical protein ACMHYJ_06130 [Castellaniella hirudinis]|uniref:hypothetical protein n=1 Tax=Castellaniella hirudinis TaxID=1144617 RepID=UPI0039C1E0DA
MPLLVALDEYDTTLRAIASHAEIGLQDPSSQTAALRIILGLCHKADESVADTMTHATRQIAGLLNTTEALT